MSRARLRFFSLSEPSLQGGLKGRRLVAFGDAVGIQGAFGVDAVGAVLDAGSSARGHHDAAITKM